MSKIDSFTVRTELTLPFPKTELPPAVWASRLAERSGRRYRFRFRVGLDGGRTVTVRATTLDAARLAASKELERRAEVQGRKPLAWELRHDRRTGPRLKMERYLVDPAPAVRLTVAYPPDGRYVPNRLVVASAISEKLILTSLVESAEGVTIEVQNVTDESFDFHAYLAVERSTDG